MINPIALSAAFALGWVLRGLRDRRRARRQLEQDLELSFARAQSRARATT